jgi:hypothetical protein
MWLHGVVGDRYDDVLRPTAAAAAPILALFAGIKVPTRSTNQTAQRQVH